MEDTTTTISPYNGTMVGSFEAWGIEEDSLLIIMWVVLGVMAFIMLLTGASWCYVNNSAMLLAFFLASAMTFMQTLLLACLLPFPYQLVQAAGILGLIGTALALCQALCATSQSLCQPEEEVLGFPILPSAKDGEEYDFQYVGCDVCGKNLSRNHFFASETLRQGMKGYEICAKCIPKHVQEHPGDAVFEYKKGYCTGQVDLSAAAQMRQDMQPLVMGS